MQAIHYFSLKTVINLDLGRHILLSDISPSIFTGVIPKISTCAFDRDDTQNGCRPARITAFSRAITVNDTSELALDRFYRAIHL